MTWCRAAALACVAAHFSGAKAATTDGNGIRIAQPIESIIVTARKVPEPDLLVPATVVTYSSDELASDRIYGFRDFVQQTPSLFALDVFSVVDTPVSLRGVAGNGSREPAVGHFVDGVYQGGDAGMLSHDLVDVERIEILHGPQGALYGKSSTAGAINVITAPATDDLFLRLTADWSDWEKRRYSAVASGPLGHGSLKGRVSASYIDFDGIERHIPSESRRGSKDDVFVRAKLNWAPSPGLDVTPSFFIRHVDEVPYPFRNVRSTGDFEGTRTTADEPGAQQFEALGFSVRARVPLGRALLELVSGGNYTDQQFLGDLDDTALPALLISRDAEKRDFSHEVRVSMDWERAYWLAGGYFFNQVDDSRQFVTDGATRRFVVSDAVARRTSSSYAIFSRVNARLTEHLDVEGQVRVDYDLRRQKDPLGRRKATFTEPSARLTLGYRVAGEGLLFASHAWAHRPGGFNDGALPRFASERTESTELGLKLAILEGRARLNLAAHYTNITDQQITEIDPVSAAQLIRNRGSAEVYGVDGLFEHQITRSLRLRLAASWLQARYGDVVTPQLGPEGFGFVDISGNRLTNAPDYSVVVGITHRSKLPPLGTRAASLENRASCRFTGEQAWDQLNTALSEAIVLCRASSALESGPITVRLYVENLLDTDYHVAYLPAYAVPFSTGSDLAVIGLQRAMGAEVTFRF